MPSVNSDTACGTHSKNWPSTLRTNSSLAGLTNDAQVDVVRGAVAEEWSAQTFSSALRDYANRRLTHGEIAS